MRSELTKTRLAVYTLLCIVLGSTLAGCSAGKANEPVIQFTTVPAAGPGGRETQEFIAGRVAGAKPKQQLVLYARSGGLWWVQPSVKAPFTSIQRDSTWRSSIHRGVEYAALLVDPGYKPPAKTVTLPDKTGAVTAKATVQGQGQGYAPPVPRSLHFSGYDWDVRQEPSDQGGKTNQYDPDNAWTDEQGLLHLRITQKAGRWTCGEVSLKRSLGQGNYLFTVRDAAQLDPAAVLAINTWDDFAVEQNHRNLGIEISRWGEPQDRNAQYVIQPYYEPSNVVRFMAPPGTLTWSFRWEAGRVAFRTARGSGAAASRGVIAEHVFTSGVPSPGGEQVHLSLYAFANARVPLRNGVEVVIEKFEYLP